MRPIVRRRPAALHASPQDAKQTSRVAALQLRINNEQLIFSSENDEKPERAWDD